MLDTTTDTGARADRRLREERIAWLTTVRCDGQPQSVPVWFPPATEIPGYIEKYRKSIARIGFDPEGFARAYPSPCA